MPSYISKGGVWHPAKERVALKNHSDKIITNPSTEGIMKDEKVKPGEDFIYQGADRAALFELFKAKVETFGVDFKNDVDLINRVRQLGYESVDAYAKIMGYDEEKVNKAFKKNAATVNKHELPEKVKAIETLGGGKDFAGQGNDIYGGFGEPKDLKT